MNKIYEIFGIIILLVLTNILLINNGIENTEFHDNEKEYMIYLNLSLNAHNETTFIENITILRKYSIQAMDEIIKSIVFQFQYNTINLTEGKNLLINQHLKTDNRIHNTWMIHNYYLGYYIIGILLLNISILLGLLEKYSTLI